MSNTTDTTKRYRLLKDLPGVKAGAIVEPNTYGIPVTSEQAKYSTWPLFYSEGGSCLNAFIPTSYVHNKDWFEEVLPVSEPVKERIEVIDFGLYKSNERWFEFGLTKVISEDKFPAIKQAIESVLNNDTEDTKVDYVGSISNDKFWLSTLRDIKEVEVNNKKFIPQSEVDTIRREAFMEARKLETGSVITGYMGNGLKYKLFSDYLSSLNSKEGGKEFIGPASLAEHPKCKKEQPTNDNAYQTLLPDCDCKSGGIIMYKNKPVCRWCRKPYGHGGMINYLPEHFEQSKQSAPEPSVLPTKDYEILSFSGKVANYGFTSNPRTEEWVNKQIEEGYPIHSVRRLSDNVVFQVGDNVLHTNNVTKREGIIESFRILTHGNASPLFVKTNNYDVPLCYITTPTEPVVEDKPLFTTDDNVNIYKDGLGIWRVFTGVHSFPSWEPINLGIPINKVEGEKYFSTKEAAEQYILLNAPKLSVNDVTNFLHKHFMFDTEYYEALKEMVKQKLSQ